LCALLACAPTPVVDAGASIADAGAIAAADAGGIPCSTGRFWTDGASGSPLMKPGSRCLDCHRSTAPRFLVAGTVHGAANDGDDCFGIAGVVVHMVGQDGAVVEATTNEAGNFYVLLDGGATLRIPYTASVSFDGDDVAMENDQTNHDCASCHTERGFPGRIVP
jgi:hypothetical protein